MIYILFESQYATFISDQQQLGPILHRLATIHLWRTDRWRTTTHANSTTFTRVRSAKNDDKNQGLRQQR